MSCLDLANGDPGGEQLPIATQAGLVGDDNLGVWDSFFAPRVRKGEGFL